MVDATYGRKIKWRQESTSERAVVGFKIHRFGTSTFTGRIIDIIENQKIKMGFFEGNLIGAGDHIFEPVKVKNQN